MRAWAAVACAALGIVLAVRLSAHAIGVTPLVWFLAASLGASGALVPSRWVRRPALALTLVCLGAGWGSARLFTRSPDSLLALVDGPSTPGPLLVSVEGVVTADPETRTRERDELDPPGRGGERAVFPLRLRRARTDGGPRGDAWTPTSGLARVVVERGTPPVRAGDRIRVTGRLVPPEPPSNAGEPPWHLFAAQSGSVGAIVAPNAELIEQLDTPAGLDAWVYSARAHIRARVSGALGDAGPVARALVLGERDFDHPERTEDAFRRAGVAHLVAVSGMHLGLLAGAALLGVRLVADRPRLALVLACCLIVLGVLLVPARPPVVRAAALFGLVALGEASGRRWDRLALLGWVSFGLVLWRPLDVFGLGLPLTVGVTALLLWMGPAMQARGLRTVRRRRTPLQTLGVRTKRTLAVCIACWLVAQPLIAYRTGVVSPLAWLATPIVFVPVAGTLALGYAAALLALISPALGAPIGHLAGWTGERTAELVTWIDTLRLTSFESPGVSFAWALVATVVAVWLVWSFVRTPRWPARTLASCALLAVVAWGGVDIRQHGRLGDGVVLRVDMLDVGDGSCVLVRSGGETMLWDAGSLAGTTRARPITAAFDALGVRRVDRAVVTHANLDHYNLLPTLAERFGVRTLTTTRAFLGEAESAGPERVLLDRVGELGIGVETARLGGSSTLGSARLDVLWPPEDEPDLSDNDSSLVVLVRVRTDAGERTVLLTGDIQARAIAGLLAGVLPGRVDVVEVPHHGAWTPDASRLLARLDPRVVLQSTGPGRLDDPRWVGFRETVVWRSTAADGAGWVEIRRDGSVRVGSVRAGSAR